MNLTLDRIETYDTVIVSFSGGKDSVACFLHLLEMGVHPSKIELWHMKVDGCEEALMDWEVTEDYCRKFAGHFGVRIYFAWKEGGFLREMMRNNEPTAETRFETPDGSIGMIGGKGPKGTRRKFPQVTADLSVRWCSSYLKIDPCAAMVRNQSRFNNKRTLVVTGERAEESKSRANYLEFEHDRSDRRSGRVRRLVDHWRPVHKWKESEVWAIIEKYKIVVHPCYYMGFSRCSCKFCIFGNKDQFASAHQISPEKAEQIALLEESFGFTIKQGEPVRQMIQKGAPYPHLTEELITLSTSNTYHGEITTKEWLLPAGAFGRSCGPP